MPALCQLIRHHFIASCAVSMIVATTAPRPAMAAEARWTSAAGGDFENSANWNNGLVPGVNDSVTFVIPGAPNGFPYVIALNGDVSTRTVQSLKSSASTTANPVIDLNGYTWTMSPTAGGTYGLVTGYPNRATIEFIGGGQVNVNSPALLGITTIRAGVTLNTQSAGIVDFVAIDGAGARWLLPGDLSVGVQQRGDNQQLLQVADGGYVESENASVNPFLYSPPFGGTPFLVGNGVLVKGLDSIWKIRHTLTLAGGSAVTVEDDGTLDVGGDIDMTTGGGLVLLGGTVRASRLLYAPDSGLVDFQSGTLALQEIQVGNTTPLGLALSLSEGRHLAIENTITLEAASSLSLNGGTLRAGAIAGPGSFSFTSGRLELTQQNLIVGDNGLLGDALVLDSARHMVIANDVIIEAGSQLTPGGGGTLRAGRIVNHGQLTVAGFLSGLEAGTVVNHGLVLGDGRLAAQLDNRSGGQLRVGNGDLVQVTGVAHSNAGAINVLGGTLEFDGSLHNAVAGVIAGRGTLIVGDTLTNAGRINLSGGITDIIGNVVNATGGTIIVSGGGNLTFFGDLVHNGSEIRVSAGSTAVYFGDVSGSGAFSGAGINFFEGSINPGNSPGVQHIEGDAVLSAGNKLVIELAGRVAGITHDLLDVGGTATLGGTLHIDLIDGFTPVAGDVFEFLVAGDSIVGSFAEVLMPEVRGLAFGLARSQTSISLVVSAAPVPLPAGAWLLGPALVGIVRWRRRTR